MERYRLSSSARLPSFTLMSYMLLSFSYFFFSASSRAVASSVPASASWRAYCRPALASCFSFALATADSKSMHDFVVERLECTRSRSWAGSDSGEVSAGSEVEDNSSAFTEETEASKRSYSSFSFLSSSFVDVSVVLSSVVVAYYEMRSFSFSRFVLSISSSSFFVSASRSSQRLLSTAISAPDLRVFSCSARAAVSEHYCVSVYG